jgi:hypothetical protein
MSQPSRLDIRVSLTEQKPQHSRLSRRNIHLYHLLWSATILNIVGLFLGIITAAVLGGFKDMVRKDKNEDISLEEVFLTLTGKKLRDYTEG